MDALLGAAGLGDIGLHFPDTDEAYAGISSMVLLSKVRELLVDHGYVTGNVDATVIAQKPKLRPYIDTMRRNIADALQVDMDCINVKATTEEKLGFSGREEGISAQAVCLLESFYEGSRPVYGECAGCKKCISQKTTGEA